MICGEHGMPEDQCREFKHVADEIDPTARAYVKGLARGIELGVEAGQNREPEIRALLRFIRERL
jgi:hypothetical protein